MHRLLNTRSKDMIIICNQEEIRGKYVPARCCLNFGFLKTYNVKDTRHGGIFVAVYNTTERLRAYYKFTSTSTTFSRF